MPPRPGPHDRRGPGQGPEGNPYAQQRMNMQLDRKTKMSTTLSNIMKRLAETQRNLGDKLK